MTGVDLGEGRRERLAAARLYLVCDSSHHEGDLPRLLRAAIAGGVDIVQLREKDMPDAQLTTLASTVRGLCDQLGALLIVNDRPHVALASGADGVHVGQEDMPPEQVRELVGEDLLIGLSTHTPRQIDAAEGNVLDYIGVGPVHATPTKPGRQPVGTELVRYASAHARGPFFAIGGLNVENAHEALAAGAGRLAVVRAIADAPDPRAAASSLRALLNEQPLQEHDVAYR
jgi:thiamine-phosphate pyrophosphorylase